MEDLNKPSVEMLLRKINTLGIKSGPYFDKFEALQLAEELVLVSCASKAHHEKFTYFPVALQQIRQRLDKPKDQFKAYFLALFSDRDYGVGSRDGAVVEHSPPTQASHQCGPGSIPGLGVICGLSLLLVLVPALRVFLRILRFSSLLKNQHFQIPVRPGTVDE